MLCDLILEGRYIKTKGFGQLDQQIITLYEDVPPKLSFKNRVIEDVWYSAKLHLTGNHQINQIELQVNGNLVDCAFTSIIIGEIQEITLTFFGDRQTTIETKQLFLLHYDNIAIAFDIYCNEVCYRFGSDYIPCVSKNIDDFSNVGLMIDTILNFEDDTIIKWVYSSQPSNSHADYGLLEGSYKKDAYKSLSSFVQLLQLIHGCYHRNLYLFKNQIKHSVTSCNKVIPYDKVKKIGNNEFIWLMQNSEQLKATSGFSTISHNEKSYLPQKLRASEIVRNQNIYENRIVYSFLKMIVVKLRLIKAKYSAELDQEKDTITQLRSFEGEGLYCPIVLVKEPQLANGDKMLKEMNLLLDLLSNLLILYKNILGCEEINLDRLPRKTKTFQAIKHYHEVYELIIRWYKYGDFDLHKEELLLKVKKIDKIFEYYCLIKLLKMAKNVGYLLDEQAGGACCYSYKVSDKRYVNEVDANNTYHLTDGLNKLTIYYQPVVYSDESLSANNIDLFRSDNDHFFIPDFIFKMQTENRTQYAILDPKYSNRENIRKWYLNHEIVKYVCSIADKNGQTPAVRLMWLLQGRTYIGCQLENFHVSKLAKKVKPIPSFGIYTLNPANSNVNELWDEIMRCII